MVGGSGAWCLDRLGTLNNCASYPMALGSLATYGGANFFASTTGVVGIGTSTPTATFSIQASTGNAPFLVSTSTGQVIMKIDKVGHIIHDQPTVPTMGTCGTSPSFISGTDNAGRFQTGSLVTDCTMNFAYGWTNANGVATAPYCDANDETTATTLVSASSTPTSVLFTGMGSSEFITFQCSL